MSHTLIRIKKYLYEEPNFKEDFSHWHLQDWTDDPRTLCTGIAYEEEAEFEIKVVKRGGITCPSCLQRLKVFKSIKL